MLASSLAGDVNTGGTDMKERTTRRQLLARAAGGAGLLILPNSASARSYQANEKLNIAVVGVGGRGGHHVRAVPQIGENLIALCDANRRRLSQVLKSVPGAKGFQDFRIMLDELDRELDAVIVATTPHTHTLIAVRAMKRGKHVYVEKPAACTVGEARLLRDTARRYQVVTQMGNQGMASDSFRRTLELVQDGAIGQVREAYAWFEFGGSGPIPYPRERPPVPDWIDWDLWLGPAPWRPYHPHYLRPGYGLTPQAAPVQGWSKWRDFCAGCLGGGGSHSINMIFKALQLQSLWDAAEPGRTIRVETEVSELCSEHFPRWQIVRYEVPARGEQPPVRIHWYNAWLDELKRRGVWQRLERLAGRPLKWPLGWAPHSGTLLVGTKGMVHTSAHNALCRLLPEADFPDSGGPPRRLPRAGNHLKEWAEACKGRGNTMSNFNHAGPVMELLLLGNVASLVLEPFRFDPVQCRVIDNDLADRALHRTARDGWAL